MPSHPFAAPRAWRAPAALPIALLLLTLALAGCGGTGGERDAPEPTYDFKGTANFPIPSAIHPNVDFWRHVYGIWGRGQVAIHDNLYMGIIHEVVELPGATRDGYLPAQEALVRERTAHHVQRLRELERKLAAGQTLSPDERQLAARYEQAGGSQAVRGAADRVRSQRGLRERFKRGLEISGRYDRQFREIMRRNGVPEDLAYLPHVESSFQTNARSKVGAGGVWQFMPATGRMLMTVNDDIDERFDPILAAEGASRYLSRGYNRLQSWPLAITAYNHGQGGMAAAKARYGDDIGKIVTQYKGPGFGFASRNFYAEFIAAREVASNPGVYFPEGVNFEPPWPHDRLVLRHAMPAQYLARHYGVSTDTLAPLNLHWGERVRAGRSNLPANATVWLPAGSLRRVASHPPPAGPQVASAESRPQPATAPVSTRTAATEARLPAVRAASASAPPARSAAKPATTAASQSKPAAATAKPATTAAGGKPKPAAAPPAKPAAQARYHVVQPQETLYRVAVRNGLTVDELRRLNGMRPGDNTIRPGQKLRVRS